MKIDINSVHATQHSEYSDIALGWSDVEGNRYHVWFNRETLVRRDTTIYKNPHLGVTFKGPGYFPTRHLSLAAGANAEAFVKVLRIANDNGLFDKAKAEALAQRELELKQHADALRKQRIEKAGPQLLTALRTLLEQGKFDLTHEKTRELIAEASAAIGQAEKS